MRTQPPISQLTGEFLDPDLERSFRDETWPEWVGRLWLVTSVGAVFFLAGGIVDWLLIGPGAVLAQMLCVRLGVAVVLLAVPLTVRRAKGPSPSADTGILAAMLAAAFTTVWIISASPGELLTHSLTVLVTLIVFYLFVPVRTAHAVLAGVAFAAAFVVEIVGGRSPAVARGELALVVLYLGLVTVLGTVFRVHLHQARRREYLLLHAERAASSSLRAEIEGRQRAESALAESEARFRALVELSPNAIAVHRDSTLLYGNPACAALVGAGDPETLVGRSILDLVRSDFHSQTLDRVERLKREAQALPSVELTLIRLDGQEIPCEVVSGPTTFGGEPAVQSVLRDASKRRRLEDELRHLAITDPLTGTYNRRHFFERFATEWTRARRHGRPLSVMMIDVDRLKEINDRCGHAAGDQALVVLAGTCRQVMRSEDLLARLGGDEFAVILPETGLDEARAVGERLRTCFATNGGDDGSPYPPFTVSVGVAQCDLENGSPESCLQRADAALLAAKRSGRDAVERG